MLGHLVCLPQICNKIHPTSSSSSCRVVHSLPYTSSRLVVAYTAVRAHSGLFGALRHLGYAARTTGTSVSNIHRNGGTTIESIGHRVHVQLVAAHADVRIGIGIRVTSRRKLGLHSPAKYGTGSRFASSSGIRNQVESITASDYGVR